MSLRHSKMDHTALEEWVENCYFGDKPKYRGANGRANKPELWEEEGKALYAALKKLSGDAVTALAKDEVEARFSALRPPAAAAGAAQAS